MYQFYLGDMLLPVAPPRLRLKIANRNQSLTLINDREITLLKAPGLTDITFQVLFPIRSYPFAQYLNGFRLPSWFLGELEKLKVEERSFPFEVIRLFDRPSLRGRGDRTDKSNISVRNVLTVELSTSMQVSLEDYQITESAENAMDMTVDIKLKQFRAFGTKTVTVNGDGSVTTEEERPAPNAPNQTGRTHTVVSGDTLRGIAARKLGDAERWREIYDLNENTIEEAARRHGRESSSNGHWIFPGTVLRLPG